MKISSKGAACILAAGIVIAFVVSLNWLVYLAGIISEPYHPLLYAVLLMVLGIVLMVQGQKLYSIALKREKQEAADLEKRRFEQYCLGIINSAKRMNA